MRLVGSALVLVLATLGTPAHAQGLPSVETTTLDLGPYIQPGTAIRISGTALRRVGGYVVGVRADTILVGAARTAQFDAGRPIQLAAVDTLWTGGTRFVTTVAMGTSLGLAVGGAVCVFSLEDSCKAFPIAVASGVALGAVVGKLRKVWLKRFVRRDGGPVPTIGPWLGR